MFTALGACGSKAIGSSISVFALTAVNKDLMSLFLISFSDFGNTVNASIIMPLRIAASVNGSASSPPSSSAAGVVSTPV